MGNLVQYDPSVIAEQAARLYSQARTIVISYSAIGFITGGIFGSGVSAAMARSSPSIPALFSVGLIGCLIGITLGRERAFRLRLQAQQMLCQVQIEFNTRPKVA